MKDVSGAKRPRTVIRSRRLLAALALVAACTLGGDGPAGTPLEAGKDVRSEGEVLEVDASAMVVDGDGELLVETAAHGPLLVRIPARERICAARGLDTFSGLEAGDAVRFEGTATDEREVTVCEAETHFLERI